MTYRRLSPACLFVLLALVLSLAPALRAQTTQPAPGVAEDRRVLVMSIDGLRPDVMLRARSPHLRSLMSEGSFTCWAQTTFMSITLPSHVSILTGVQPLRHQIVWNSDMEFKKPFYPKSPTLFQVAKRAGYSTAMVAGKTKFDHLLRPGTVDWWFVPEKVDTTTEALTYAGVPTKQVKITDGLIAEEARMILAERRPQVMFVHFPEMDAVGHAKGWGSKEQVAAAERADAAVGKVLSALEDLGLRQRTLIIVTADHGGSGFGHGPEDARSRHVPWIIVGPGIRKDYDLTQKADLGVRVEDTFATACDWLGLPLAAKLDGQSQLANVREPKPAVDMTLTP